jgi:hypothetical protein
MKRQLIASFHDFAVSLPDAPSQDPEGPFAGGGVTEHKAPSRSTTGSAIHR